MKRTTAALTIAILTSILAPGSAWAQKRHVSSQEAGATTAAAIIGSLAGMGFGLVGGATLYGTQCARFDGVCLIGYSVLGASAVGLAAGFGSGMLASSVFDSNHSTTSTLIGAGVGAAAGLGALLLVDPTREFSNPGPWIVAGTVAYPLLGAGLGGIVGYMIPTGDTSISLMPRDGGASAHVGFSF